MISYKTWKILQENLGQTNLGVKSPNAIGGGTPLFGMMKKKKHTDFLINCLVIGN